MVNASGCGFWHHPLRLTNRQPEKIAMSDTITLFTKPG
jgi:hypothetical protein